LFLRQSPLGRTRKGDDTQLGIGKQGAERDARTQGSEPSKSQKKRLARREGEKVRGKKQSGEPRGLPVILTKVT